MARVQNTLIGKSSGSVGGVTFSTWKGLHVIRSKPASVANPNTLGQVEARTKMKNGVKAFRSLAAVASLGFIQQAIGQSAYNAFISANIQNGSLNPTTGGIFATAAYLQISKGTMTPTAPLVSSIDHGDGQVTVTWSTDLSGDQQATDQAVILAMKSDGTVLGFSIGDEMRSTGTYNLEFNQSITASTIVYVYMFFYNPTARKVSDSRNLHVTAS